MNTLYVGIDLSSKSNVVYLMLPNGDKVCNFTVANSHDGSIQLVKRILSALNSYSLVRCDKEYSRFYHLKYNEVNRCQHKRALALTARKFVRLVFTLLKDNRLYRAAD